MASDHQWPTDSTITLRPLSHDDAADQLAGEDAELVRWLYGDESTPATVHRYITRSRECWAAGGPTFTFGIRTLRENALVGTIEVQLDKEFLAAGQANIAYGLYPKWRGKGLATRAVRLAVTFLRRNTDVVEVLILTSIRNPASAAVAARAGFRRAGQLDDESDILDRHLLAIER